MKLCTYTDLCTDVGNGRQDRIVINVKLNCGRVAVYAANLVQKVALLPD